MSDKLRELGKVKEVFFGREGHGLMTLWVHVDFGGTGQGFGGYGLDSFDKKRDRRVGTAGGLDLVMRLLDLFDVDSLDKIKGRPVYALRDSETWNSPITGLETPAFDGGKRLLVAEWQREWFPDEKTA